MNRIDRLTGMILLLQGRRVITAQEVADHFEISLRTVYRDIAALGEAGVPIVAEAGVGYSIARGYHMPPVAFTPGEAGALFMGAELVSHLADTSLYEQMRSALAKIRSVLPAGHQGDLDRLEKSTALFITSQRGPRPHHPALAQLQHAIARCQVVALDYRTGGGEEATRRTVEPLGIVYYSSQWHLIAYCRLREDYRDFRTDRIVSLAVRDETFAPHETFSLADHIASWSEQVHGIDVELRLTPRAADRVRRHWTQGRFTETATPEGVVLRFQIGNLDWITPWVLSHGTEVEILAPPELRDRVAAQAERLADFHRRPPA